MIVGENGTPISGQRQRIAIARALYKTSNLLVFDEATSGFMNKLKLKLLKIF